MLILKPLNGISTELGHLKEHTELRTGTVDSAFAGFGEYVKDRHSVKAPIVLRGRAL